MNKNCKESKIIKCNKCDISCNQKPLVNNMRESDIMFLGISAKIKEKEDEMPLSENATFRKY